jgi:hydrogenase/urease accessory protein HupE
MKSFLFKHLLSASKIIRIAILLIISFIPFFLAVQTVQAHEYSSSFTVLELTKPETILTFTLDEISVIELVGGDQNDDGILEPDEFETVKNNILSVISENVLVKINGEEQSWSNISKLYMDREASEPQLYLEAIFTAVSPSQSISLTDNLYLNDRSTNYVNLLKVDYGDNYSTAAIAGKDRNWSMLLTETDYAGLPLERKPVELLELENLNSQHANTSGWFSFLKLGMDHILFGFDHLLFLLALLILRQSFKQIAFIVTSFTIAHSITISLTVLGWIQVPSMIVEVIIALSICYVALENIFRKNINNRALLTFFFGLIHGMGFAGILLEMNIPKKDLAVNLASFNIGIEIIQLAIVILLLPFLNRLYRYKNYNKVLISVSIFSFLLGLIWLIERLFF